jgi:hypothetical protein
MNNGQVQALTLTLRLAATIDSYSTSLKAKRKAAVRTDWLTLGAIPVPY